MNIEPFTVDDRVMVIDKNHDCYGLTGYITEINNTIVYVRVSWSIEAKLYKGQLKRYNYESTIKYKIHTKQS